MYGLNASFIQYRGGSKSSWKGIVGYGAMPPGKLSGFYPLQRNLTISRLVEVNQLRIKQFYHIIFMKS